MILTRFDSFSYWYWIYHNVPSPYMRFIVMIFLIFLMSQSEPHESVAVIHFLQKITHFAHILQLYAPKTLHETPLRSFYPNFRSLDIASAIMYGRHFEYRISLGTSQKDWERVRFQSKLNTQTTVVIYIFRACFSTSCRYSEVLIENFNGVSFDIIYICNLRPNNNIVWVFDSSVIINIFSVCWLANWTLTKSGRLSNYTAKPSGRYFRLLAMQACPI
jgi:hypothetical protein